MKSERQTWQWETDLRPVKFHLINATYHTGVLISNANAITCHYKSSCDNTEDKLLTFNQLPQLMPHPQRSRWLWPASQCQMPGPADWRQHGESLRLGVSGPAMVPIDHRERSHQHCLEHLHWQIIQLLQQQHQQHFHHSERHVLSNDCPTTYWLTLDERLKKAIIDIKLLPRTVYEDKVKQRGAP